MHMHFLYSYAFFNCACIILRIYIFHNGRSHNSSDNVWCIHPLPRSKKLLHSRINSSTNAKGSFPTEWPTVIRSWRLELHMLSEFYPFENIWLTWDPRIRKQVIFVVPFFFTDNISDNIIPYKQETIVFF